MLLTNAVNTEGRPLEIYVKDKSSRNWVRYSCKNNRNLVVFGSCLHCPAIEGLDTKAAIQLLGSPQLYMTVLKDYYRVIKQKAELIKKYEQQEDWHAYTIETHALKSASRQIGATDLAESAARLELAGSRQDAALIHEQTASLLHDYLQYQSILQPYFQKEEKISAQETITAPVLEKLFYAMYDAIDNLNSDILLHLMYWRVL